MPLYKIRNIRAGNIKSPKYIIFASTGPKPDIVIDDAVNMDIRIVRFAEKCLVYNEPPPSGDLTWQMLVDWWGKTTGIGDREKRRKLGQRLLASLQDGPEKFFFETYFKNFHPIYKEKLPALLPQVYLHYDPRNQDERSKPILVRQRMDFLMMLRNATRVVMEIDGKQHYADNNGLASPSNYAIMVAEDRRIKLMGYEIFRFGGAEFIDEEYALKHIVDFFERLFTYHNIHP